MDPKALSTRTWAGVKTDVFALPSAPAWSEPVAMPPVVFDPLPSAAVAAAAPPGAATGKAGAGKAAPAAAPAKTAAPAAAAAGKGKGAAAEAPVAEAAGGRGDGPAVTTLYTSATRHIARARDEWHGRWWSGRWGGRLLTDLSGRPLCVSVCVCGSKEQRARGAAMR